MTSLVAAMLWLLESGQMAGPRPAHAALEARERQVSALSPALVDRRWAAQGCERPGGCEASGLEGRQVLGGLARRFGIEPPVGAALWLERSGIGLEVQHGGLRLCLRLPSP